MRRWKSHGGVVHLCAAEWEARLRKGDSCPVPRCREARGWPVAVTSRKVHRRSVQRGLHGEAASSARRGMEGSRTSERASRVGEELGQWVSGVSHLRIASFSSLSPSPDLTRIFFHLLLLFFYITFLTKFFAFLLYMIFRCFRYIK